VAPQSEPFFFCIHHQLVADLVLAFEFFRDSTPESSLLVDQQAKTQGELFAEKVGDLFKRGELTDVVLVANDGRELAAHRTVLGAHSPVGLLRQNMLQF
jgi:hypothetical protein